ncbi:SCO family protein, partial [Thioclava sp. BHET1]
TGTSEQIHDVERKYRIFSHIADPSNPYYVVDHSTFTYLMLPGSRYAGAFRRETTAEEMADGVSCALRVKGAI